MIFCGSKILLLFYLFGWWLLVHSNDVLSLLRSDIGDFCITNSSSALSYTLLNGSISEGTKLIPEPQYSCNFEDVSGCTNDFNKTIWNRVNSLEYENIPIFDRRWEDLPVTTLEHSSFNRLLELKNSENFNITLSLRATKVQFQFCDGKEVETASCYWFFLENGKLCIMNKPSTGQIPVTTRDSDYSLCEYDLEYPSVEPFIEMGKWRHITFEKQYQHFYVKTIENGKTRKLLHYEDENELIRIQYMFGNSESPAYCKLHKYYYLRTTDVIKEFTTLTRQLGKKVDGTAYLCFSMFLTTCEQCSTEVIASSNLTLQKVHGRKQLPSSFGYWTKHKIIFRNMNNTYFFIGIRTTSNSTISNNFWSIDNFRYCSSEEYRVSVKQISNLKNCELLSPSTSLSWGESTDITNIKCNSVEHLSGLCIPCNELIQNGIVRSCQRIKICENMNGNDRCFCSPGYIGPNCQKACQGRTFGNGCKEKCGNCRSNTPCNSIHGFCDCDPFFEGNTCHKPKRGSILKEPPLLIESRPNSCIVQLANKEHYGEDEFKFFLVQYQKQENSGTRGLSTGFSGWTDYGKIRSINENNTVKVGDLDTNTEYSIRILISYYQQKVKFLQNFTIPFTVCTTTCNALDTGDIHITQENEIVLFEIKLPRDKCSITLYRWIISTADGIELKNGSAQRKFRVTSLPSFTTLKIYFFGPYNISKDFQTEEGVPSEVEGIVYDKLSKNTAQVRWKEPTTPNGIIKNYRIIYKRIRTQYCSKEVIENVTEKVVDFSYIVLTSLAPFSTYQVTIHANNGKYENNGSTIEIPTLGLDTFSKDEGLEKIRIIKERINQTSAVLKIENFNCQSIQGFLQIKYRCNSTDYWCNERSEKFGVTDLQKGVIIKDLQTFCTYNCIISLCRSDNCSDIWHDSFQTKASNPNNISEVIVFSKGKDYINLKWLPPFPPTGSLTYRVITECKNYYQTYTHNFDPYRCSIWQDYDCAYLTEHIVYGNTYSLQIQAANKEINEYFDVYQIFNVSVEEKASDPPEDLQTYWFQNNTLVVYWKHPNKTNGNLTNFQIILEIDMNYTVNKTFKQGSNFTERDYQLTYHSRFPIPPSVDVQIEVIALNNMKSKSATKNDSSYPSVPYLLNPLILITDSTESTISVQLNILLRNTRDKEKNGYYLFVLVSDPVTKSRDHNLEHLENLVNETLDDGTQLRVSSEFYLNDVNTNLFNFVIGENDEKKSILLNRTVIVDKPLEAGQFYNITILLVSEYNKKFRIKKYNIGNSTQPRMSFNHGENGAYALLLLLFLIPVIVGLIIFRKKCYQTMATVSLGKIMDIAVLNITQSRSNNEVLMMESKESTPEITNLEMRDKNNLSLSGKSTNPPNRDENIHSKPVKLANLEEYIKKAIESGELIRQHSLFPRAQTQPYTYGSLAENKSKNRYNNLIAYDHSRVRLEKLPEDEYSDYINANYIHGYRVRNAFIATQGPKQSTLRDFWRMIWQENVKHIIMLANIYEGGKKKVEQYWPNINEELNIGNISIKYISVEIFADFEYKIFTVTRGKQTRKLEQLHFTSWPDHGVPLYPQSLVPFLRKILRIRLSSSHPVVIHCSAGVGRTGTIILSDICLRMAAKEGAVDMLNHLQKLREQRSNMVDNVEQYKLAHLVILETLMGLHSSIPCNIIDRAMEKLIHEEEYKIQIEYLIQTQWQDDAMKSVAEADEEFVIYPEKNRFPDIVPDNKCGILLPRYPSTDFSSSYINAVKVDGFRNPDRFIVTQSPMPNTLSDFWRLVVQQGTTVIISLNDISPEDETCCQFIPTTQNPELRPEDFMLVTLIKQHKTKNYEVHSVRIWVNNFEKPKFDVDIISLKGWKPGKELPSSCEEFLSFWEEADTLSRRSRTVLVTCYDGRTASGIYVALSFVIEKIKLEQECDVCLAVRNVRHNRKQFVTSEVQFLFLYEVAVRYIKGFQSYANFQEQN